MGAALPHPRLRQTRPIDHRHWAGIQATLLHDLSNGLVESVNTRIGLLTRIAFGFKSRGAHRAGHAQRLPAISAAFQPGPTNPRMKQKSLNLGL